MSGALVVVFVVVRVPHQREAARLKGAATAQQAERMRLRRQLRTPPSSEPPPEARPMPALARRGNCNSKTLRKYSQDGAPLCPSVRAGIRAATKTRKGPGRHGDGSGPSTAWAVPPGRRHSSMPTCNTEGPATGAATAAAAPPVWPELQRRASGGARRYVAGRGRAAPRRRCTGRSAGL